MLRLGPGLSWPKSYTNGTRYISGRKKGPKGRRGASGEANPSRKLIVGLGNPGSQYQATRHNIGWTSIDLIADKHGIALSKSKFNSVYGSTRQIFNRRLKHQFQNPILTQFSTKAGTIGKQNVIIVKPQTYMNLSGTSVKPWLDYYKIKEQDWYVPPWPFTNLLKPPSPRNLL